MTITVGQTVTITVAKFGDTKTSTVTVCAVDSDRVWVRYGTRGAQFPVKPEQIHGEQS